MKIPDFDWRMVRLLVLKDWQVQPAIFVVPLVLDFSFLFFSLRYLVAPSHSGAIPVLVFLTVFMMLAAHFAALTQLFQQRQKTRFFLRSLPISRPDLLAAKYLAFLLPFLLPWSLLLAVASIGAASHQMAGQVAFLLLVCLIVYLVALAICVIDAKGGSTLAVMAGCWSIAVALTRKSSFRLGGENGWATVIVALVVTAICVYLYRRVLSAEREWD